MYLYVNQSSKPRRHQNARLLRKWGNRRGLEFRQARQMDPHRRALPSQTRSRCVPEWFYNKRIYWEFFRLTDPVRFWVNVKSVYCDHTAKARLTSLSVSFLLSRRGYLEILYVKSLTRHRLPENRRKLPQLFAYSICEASTNLWRIQGLFRKRSRTQRLSLRVFAEGWKKVIWRLRNHPYKWHPDILPVGKFWR